MEELDQVLQMLGMQSSGEEDDDDDEYEYDNEDEVRPRSNNNNNVVTTRAQQQQQEHRRYRGPDPMYETWEQGGAVLDDQWPLKLPPNRMRNQTTQSVDLSRMLKALDIAPHDLRVHSAVQQLSTIIKDMRVSLREQSRRCDLDLYWTYLIVLKRLTRYFDNSDCMFEAYFPGCMVNRSTHFLYEYMQVLLLTAARLSEQAQSSKGDTGATAQSAKDMELVKFLLEELKRCVEYCLSDKLMQNGKWFYQPPLEAMGSNQSTQQQRQQQVVQIMNHDRQQLHRFIHQDLHGLEGIELRCLLCNTKMIELCVAVLNEKLVALPDASVRCEKTYEKVVPLMLTVRQTYDEIRDTLRQQAPPQYQHNGLQCTLLRYAQFQSYMWYVKTEMVMANAEWACYGADAMLDIEVYAKRAIKRLKVLVQSFGDKEQWLLGLRPGNALRKKWDATKKQVLQFHDDVRKEVIDSVWRTAGACSIPEIRAHRHDSDDRSLTTVFADKWERLLSDKRYQCLVVVLEYLDNVSTCGGGTSNNDYREPVATDYKHADQNDTELDNQFTLGVVHDRKMHLDWLVSMIEPGRNVITIGSEGCNYLRKQQIELEQFIALKNISIIPATSMDSVKM